MLRMIGIVAAVAGRSFRILIDGDRDGLDVNNSPPCCPMTGLAEDPGKPRQVDLILEVLHHFRPPQTRGRFGRAARMQSRSVRAPQSCIAFVGAGLRPRRPQCRPPGTAQALCAVVRACRLLQASNLQSLMSLKYCAVSVSYFDDEHKRPARLCAPFQDCITGQISERKSRHLLHVAKALQFDPFFVWRSLVVFNKVKVIAHQLTRTHLRAGSYAPHYAA